MTDQLTLFELDETRCLQCGSVIRDLGELRRLCPQSPTHKGIHRVGESEYFKLYYRSPDKLSGLSINGT